jgi:hypothetical protein
MSLYIALKSIVGLIALWIFVYYLWRDYRLDSFRDDVFSIRDQMFVFAANGNITFDHPAYTILRNRMNVLLRYGHAFTLTRLVLIKLTHPLLKNDLMEKWESAVEQLPVETQVRMKEFNLRLTVSVFQHIVYSSFFRYVMVRPFMFLINPFRMTDMKERVIVVFTVEHLESDAVEQEARQGRRAHAVVV